MANPYLPNWEYIPDGEPRVWGNRVYVYGSHDQAGSDKFCDYVLKCWSAPIDNLNDWTCHGDIFRTQADASHRVDTNWTKSNNELYAPDVVEKDGKYYLFAYIINSRGCVAVSDRPEGPYELVAQYKSDISDAITCNGWFIDPGVLVDDDGRNYIYCGFERSFMAELKDNMYETVEGSCVEHFIPNKANNVNGFDRDEDCFFEAASPRKINGTYYMIYSPNRGSRLAYATSDSPVGPYVYRGYIVDNGDEYPGGNNHGSLACINGQWYIFYHRMTNGTIMSRRGCVERIEILPDGSIPTVKMTSLGFEESLNPYKITQADIACVLKGGCFVIEHNVLDRVVTGITDGAVIGYRYYDFGIDGSDCDMNLVMNINGCGCCCEVHVLLDSEDGREIGRVNIGLDGGVMSTKLAHVEGRHAIFFKVTTRYEGWMGDMFKGRQLFELKSFVFTK